MMATRQSGSDRFVARVVKLAPAVRWVANLFRGRCPDCRSAMSSAKLFRHSFYSGEPAACPACGAQWVARDGTVMLLIKFFFVGVPIILVAVGLTGWVLGQMPFFQNPEPVAPNDALLFRAFPVVVFVFYAAGAFFFRRLPLKKVDQ
jgi:hypothetical protein